MRALQRQGVEPVDNPLQVLQELAAEVVSLRDYMRDRIDQGNVGGEHLAAYEHALDRVGRLLTDLSRLDLAEEGVSGKATEHPKLQAALALLAAGQRQRRRHDATV